MKKKAGTVHVGTCTYTVENRHLENDRGQCHTEHSLILIDPTLPPDKMKLTLLHELFHAITDEYGVFTSMNLSAEEKERVVDITTIGLMDTVKKNPGLFKRLFFNK